MFRHLTTSSKAMVCFVITFLLVLIVVLLPLASGDLTQLLSMLTPAVAVLLMLLVVTPDGRSRAAWLDLGLHRGGRQRWAVAVLLPVLIIGGAYAILWLTPFAKPGWPVDSSLGDLIITILMNGAITLIFATTEEIGWRGYRLPRLLGLGARRATLLVGLLHGLFHLPLLLLTSCYHGAGDQRVVVPLFGYAVAAGWSLSRLPVAQRRQPPTVARSTPAPAEPF